MTDPDPKTLAAAITRMEAEIALFPEAEFPVEHEQVRAVVAAAKAYQVMREALKELLDAFECDPDDIISHEYEAIVADAKARARAALSKAGV
jgi:hypothetical protein